MGNASFLLDELLYSVGPDDGSDQVALVGPRVFLLHCLLSPAEMAELVIYDGDQHSHSRSIEICALITLNSALI